MLNLNYRYCTPTKYNYGSHKRGYALKISQNTYDYYALEIEAHNLGHWDWNYLFVGEKQVWGIIIFW
jgi:hypothetical protein